MKILKAIQSLIVTLCCLCVLAFPIPTHAAQANRTLQTGRLYEFTNSDARITSYVSVSGGTRYDYVTRTPSGDIADFGTATGRFAVRGGGTTIVTVSGGSVSVSYDAAILSVRESAGAALTRVSAGPNETVTITSNLNIPLQIAVDNTGRTDFSQYDCVVRDRSGAVSFFADACAYTVLPIPASGAAAFTAGAGGLILMYPSDWTGKITASKDSNAPSLRTYSMKPLTTYTLVNTGTADCEVSIPGTYDYILLNAEGYTLDYAYRARNGRIPVYAGNTVYITPQSETHITIPLQQQEYLTLKEGGSGALTAYTIGTGETLTIANTSAAQSFTFRADVSDSAATLDYIYNGGPYAQTVYATDTPFTGITVSAGAFWTSTVTKGTLTLRFPESWLVKGITADSSSRPALAEHTLSSGSTLTITNADPAAAYGIQLAGALDTGLSYDYSIRDDWGVSYETGSALASLTLPPGGTITLTAGSAAPMSVCVPNNAAITVGNASTQAMGHFTLLPGESLEVENNDDTRLFALSLRGAANASITGLDYVLKDETGRITAFGRADMSLSFELDAGHRVLFTNTTLTQAAVAFPGEWLSEGLTAQPSIKQALKWVTLTENQTVEIINTDRKNERYLPVEAAPGAAAVVSYDYAAKNDKSGVVEYGAGCSADTLYVGGGGRTLLMPRRGVRMTIACPAEIYDLALQLTEITGEPLYRETVKPNARIKLNNRTNQTYEVQTTGRYYIRHGDDNHRISSSERTLTGPVEVTGHTVVTLIAAAGMDMEIVMPREWAGKLIK